MKNPLSLAGRWAAVVVAVAAMVCAGLLMTAGCGHSANTNPPRRPGSAANSSATEATVVLAPDQLSAIKIEPVGTCLFSVEREALGTIDYDQNRSVQVFSPYPGKIITPLANLGDKVQKGQPLYTIDSPNLVQAESTLIGAAAAFARASKELERATALRGINGVSEREIEQATSEQRTAEGALRAARDAVRVFGKTEAETDRIAATRQIDPALVVPSPLTGRVTARNAQPGLFVQPGNEPAPYSVADLTTKWMVANVTENDSPLIRVGQPIEASVMAYPGRAFNGRISKLGAAVDPATARVMVRCEIADPKEELRPGMLANFTIRVQAPVESIAIPTNGVVRNGDGTMAAWVTTDRHRFSQRIIKLGRQRDGKYQVIDGLERGELAVTDGAIFLSSMLRAPPSD